MSNGHGAASGLVAADVGRWDGDEGTGRGHPDRDGPGIPGEEVTSVGDILDMQEVPLEPTPEEEKAPVMSRFFWCRSTTSQFLCYW